jgi:hypothetical protein
VLNLVAPTGAALCEQIPHDATRMDAGYQTPTSQRIDFSGLVDEAGRCGAGIY